MTPTTVKTARNEKEEAKPKPTKVRQERIGAGEGIRTLDPNLGKVVLYP